MIFRHLPLMRAPLLLALATPVLLTACWLPPKEVIKEKAAARKAWRAQEKQRKALRDAYPKQIARVNAGLAAAPKQPVTIAISLPDEDLAAMPFTGPLPDVPKATSAAVVTSPPKSTEPAPARSAEQMDPIEGTVAKIDAAPQTPRPKRDKENTRENTREKAAKGTPARQMGALTPIEGVANMVAITRPSSPLAVSAPWQDGASADQLARIDGWQAQFERDKNVLISGGDGIQIAKQGRLFETDAAMIYGLIPPGLYDCRLVQINTPGKAWHEGKTGKCRVLLQGEGRKLSFIMTQEVMLGDLHENDGFSSVFLGQALVASMGGIGPTATAEIGLIQRIADTRWRIILPMDGGGTAVVEVTRPRVAE